MLIIDAISCTALHAACHPWTRARDRPRPDTRPIHAIRRGDTNLCSRQHDSTAVASKRVLLCHRLGEEKDSVGAEAE